MGIPEPLRWFNRNTVLGGLFNFFGRLIGGGVCLVVVDMVVMVRDGVVVAIVEPRLIEVIIAMSEVSVIDCILW